MTDRDALLAAIQADPTDDTVRLALADWLDEFGTGDLDRTTAEFVRLACDCKPAKDRQSRAEGRWLHTRWPRLVPTLDAAGLKMSRREGRWLHAFLDVPSTEIGRPSWRHQGRGEWPTYTRLWVGLEFWRGFVRRASFSLARDANLLLPDLLADQPLAEPELDGLIFPPESEGGAGAIRAALLKKARQTLAARREGAVA